MSMGIVLEQAILHLPDYLDGLEESRNYGIEFDALPIPTTSDFYIAIWDGGVTGSGRAEDYLLEEYLNLQVGIWRRFSEIPRDRVGRMAFRSDTWRPQALTLDVLERKVVKAFHHNWAFHTRVNAAVEAEGESAGATYRDALYYLGRSADEPYTPDGHVAQEVPAFFGRRLRFRGLLRTQDITLLRD